MMTSLGKSVLLLFDASDGNEDLAFECVPWTLNRWRTALGLMLVKSNPGEDTDNAPSDGGLDRNEVASASNGFAFSTAALSTFTTKQHQCLTDGPVIRAAEGFLQHFWEQTRSDMDRNKPFSYTFDTLPNDQGKHEDPSWPGFLQYRRVVLAMLNRPGGVVAKVDDTMARMGCAPLDKWREARDVNRSLPPRRQKNEDSLEIAITVAGLDDEHLQAAVAEELFGPAAFSSGGVVLPSYSPTIKCLLYRRYENLARKLRTLRSQSIKGRDALDCSLKEAGKSRTPAALKKASDDLITWRKIALKSREHEEAHFICREKQLEDLWEEVGFEVKDAGKKNVPHPKGKKKSVLPTSEEMRLAYEYYIDEYCNGLGSIHNPDDSPTHLFENPLNRLIEDEGDIGVEHLREWTVPMLWESMGVEGATQFPFAEPGVISPMATGEAPKKAAIPYWHQQVGAHRILEGAFTEKIGKRASPTLLLDDVGLGKTIQIIGVYSMLRHYYEQQALDKTKQLAPPPFTIARNTPYFDGLKSIPNLPSIVIPPTTLSDQWLEQWTKFTQSGAFAIVRFSVGQGPLEQFSTDPNGAYLQAAGPNLERASSVIIVADLSAVAAESKRCLEEPSKSRKRKDAEVEDAKGEVARFKPGVDTTGSLLAMRFRAAAVDECHNLRNSSHAQRGVQMITNNSHIVIGATATLIYTNIWNALAQARIMRYEPVLGEKGVLLTERMRDSVNKRSKEWNQTSHKIIQGAALQEARVVAEETGIDTKNPLFAQIDEQVQAKYQHEEQVKVLHSTYVFQDAIKMLREVLWPIIIRRTGDSLDNNQKPILGLPPFQTLTAWSQMSTEERKTQQEINEEHRQRKKAGHKDDTQDPAMIKWHNFLYSQKDAAVHILIHHLKKLEIEKRHAEGHKLTDIERRTLGRSIVKTITADWNESNIDSKVSTRMLKVDEIIQHYWVGNPSPVVFKEDGTRDTTTVVNEPWPADDPRKFLIYVAYHTHRDLMAAMFKIKKQGYVCYDGSMQTHQRQAAVDKFNTDPACRIMIISNVGSAGLNLVAASVVIVVSNVWSGQEKNQIFGRVVRPGQKRDVVCYNIVAPGGIDLALTSYSESKSSLSEQFLMSRGMLRRIYGEVTAPDAECDEGEEAEPQESTKATKVVARKRKRNLELETEGSEPGTPTKHTKPSGKKNGAGSKEGGRAAKAQLSAGPSHSKMNVQAPLTSSPHDSSPAEDAPIPSAVRMEQQEERRTSHISGVQDQVMGAKSNGQGTVQQGTNATAPATTTTPGPGAGSQFMSRRPRAKATAISSGSKVTSRPNTLAPGLRDKADQTEPRELQVGTQRKAVAPVELVSAGLGGQGGTVMQHTATTTTKPRVAQQQRPRPIATSHGSGQGEGSVKPPVKAAATVLLASTGKEVHQAQPPKPEVGGRSVAHVPGAHIGAKRTQLDGQGVNSTQPAASTKSMSGSQFMSRQSRKPHAASHGSGGKVSSVLGGVMGMSNPCPADPPGLVVTSVASDCPASSVQASTHAQDLVSAHSHMESVEPPNGKTATLAPPTSQAAVTTKPPAPKGPANRAAPVSKPAIAAASQAPRRIWDPPPAKLTSKSKYAGILDSSSSSSSTASSRCSTPEFVTSQVKVKPQAPGQLHLKAAGGSHQVNAPELHVQRSSPPAQDHGRAIKPMPKQQPSATEVHPQKGNGASTKGQMGGQSAHKRPLPAASHVSAPPSKRPRSPSIIHAGAPKPQPQHPQAKALKALVHPQGAGSSHQSQSSATNHALGAMLVTRTDGPPKTKKARLTVGQPLPSAGPDIGVKGVFERIREEGKGARVYQQRLREEHLFHEPPRTDNPSSTRTRVMVKPQPSSARVPQKEKEASEHSSAQRRESAWLSDLKARKSQTKVVGHPDVVSSREGEN